MAFILFSSLIKVYCPLQKWFRSTCEKFSWERNQKNPEGVKFKDLMATGPYFYQAKRAESGCRFGTLNGPKREPLGLLTDRWHHRLLTTNSTITFLLLPPSPSSLLYIDNGIWVELKVRGGKTSKPSNWSYSLIGCTVHKDSMVIMKLLNKPVKLEVQHSPKSSCLEINIIEIKMI